MKIITTTWTVFWIAALVIQVIYGKGGGLVGLFICLMVALGIEARIKLH